MLIQVTMQTQATILPDPAAMYQVADVKTILEMTQDPLEILPEIQQATQTEITSLMIWTTIINQENLYDDKKPFKMKF